MPDSLSTPETVSHVLFCPAGGSLPEPTSGSSLPKSRLPVQSLLGMIPSLGACSPPASAAWLGANPAWVTVGPPNPLPPEPGVGNLALSPLDLLLSGFQTWKGRGFWGSRGWLTAQSLNTRGCRNECRG